MKKILFIIVSFLHLLFYNSFSINAESIILNDYMYAYEINNEISIYSENIFITKINNASMLDFKNNYLLYNENDSLYLYDLNEKEINLISKKAYNALITDDYILYESNKDDTLTCKDVIESIKYRNCYKLYAYDIINESHTLLELPGNDNYLNDIKNNYLVYTSIHSSDVNCTSLCSFVNLFNLESKENIILNRYQDIVLDMSGNGFIDNNKIIFESIPNIYGCQNVQIFIYDIGEKTIEMITKDSNTCFMDNNEIVFVSDHYIVFSSKYNHYDDNKSINYIYSINDNKYKKIDNNCSYKNVVIKDDSIYCLDNENILIYKIDTNSPIINTNKQYIALKEGESKLIDNLEYYDDLSNRDSIKVDLLSNLSDVGIKEVEVRLCDKYDNCSVNMIVVEIIDIDITPPKIYCNELITIKNNQNLDISKYGFALDNVDGKLPIEIEGEVNYSKGGEYVILLKSVDSSGNIGYMEVKLVVYHEMSLLTIYYVLVLISIILVIIIYILRVKNRRHF